MKKQLTIDCEPKALSRTRASNGRHYYTQKKQDEMNELSWAIIEGMNIAGVKHLATYEWATTKPKKAIIVELVFYISLPKSLSKKKRSEMIGKPHLQKPDLDNLIKNVLDRCNGVLWSDDDCVCEIKAKKVWAEKGKIEMTIDYE